MREDGHKPRPGDANRDAAKRIRAHARGLSGRLFRAPDGRILVVSGPPDADDLIDHLVKLKGPPAEGRDPTPRELGFPADAVVPLSRSGLASRGRSVQKWRAMVVNELGGRQLRPARRDDLQSYLAEIDRLTAQVRTGYEVLDRGTEADPSPYVLPAGRADELRTPAARAAAGRAVPPAAAWLSRLVAWLADPAAAVRFLAAVAVDFPRPQDVRTFDTLTRLRDLLRAPESAVPTDAEYAAVTRAAAALPAELQDVWPRRRSLTVAELARRADELLAGYPPPFRWDCAVAYAVFCAFDPSEVGLPWEWAREHLTPNLAGEFFDDRGKAGYGELVAHLAVHRPPVCKNLTGLRRLLLGGSAPDDVAWWGAALHSGGLYADGGGVDVGPVRRVCEWLDGGPSKLDKSERKELWDAYADPANAAGVAALDRYLAWLPKAARTPQVLAETKALVRLVSVPGALSGPVRDRFRAWAEVPRGVRLPPDCPAGLPDAFAALLRRIAYYQRAAGEVPRLPKSLRKPLTAAGRGGRELEFLRAEASAGRLDDAGRKRLEYLIERAADDGPAAEDAGIDFVRLARQAEEVCATAALHAARQMVRKQVDEWWLARIGEARPETVCWEHAVELLRWVEGLAPDDNGAVARTFAAYRGHGADYRRHLPENRDWLTRAAAKGLDLGAWFHPPDETVATPTGSVVLAAAKDPPSVYLMGTWFGTCLGLRDGGNQRSVLANAADANKAVLYARAADGSPLARKLVAVSDAGRYLGYRTYYRDSGRRDELEPLLQAFCGRWAARVGVDLADAGKPASPAGRFWYDDGTEPWGRAARAAWSAARGETPETPCGSAADPEGAWVEAVSDADPERLERFLRQAPVEPWYLSAVARYVLAHPARAAGKPDLLKSAAGEDDWPVQEYLTARGRWTGPASPRARGTFAEKTYYFGDFVTRTFADLLAVAGPSAAGDWAGLLRRSQNAAGTDLCAAQALPPAALARLPLGLLTRLFDDLRASTQRECGPGCYESWPEPWVLVLAAASRRDTDLTPVRKALAKADPLFRRVVARVCGRTADPRWLDMLRRDAKKWPPGPEADAAAAALAGPLPPREAEPLAEARAVAATTTPAERLGLPLADRERYAEAAMTGPPESWGSAIQRTALVFDWLETLPPGRQRWHWENAARPAEELLPDAVRFLLTAGLEGEDAARRAAVTEALRYLAEVAPARALACLDHAFAWALPSAVDPVADELIPRVLPHADGSGLALECLTSRRLRGRFPAT